MRGKGIEPGYERVTVRITPSYAGKSGCTACPATRSGDHPRVCGEKSLPSCPTTDLIGSPPRMRGKGVDALSGCLSAGITPAYAGKRRAAEAAEMID